MRRLKMTLLIVAVSYLYQPCVYAWGKDSLPELKKELRKAHKELSSIQAHVKKLEETIAYQEIKQIESEIQRIEAKEVAKLLHTPEQRLAFFSAQRETLSSIIHNYPICAPQAQTVLDQLLTLITQISNELLD